jgi:hypothetical protein
MPVTTGSMMPVTTDGGRLTPEQTLISVSGVAWACAGEAVNGVAITAADATRHAQTRFRRFGMILPFPFKRSEQFNRL